jgi:4-alpha-glucanotransferase
MRPNQLWVLASPLNIFDKEKASRALLKVKTELLTPYGLRTLSIKDPEFKGQCVGSQKSRDQAYHGGTVWPWLLGIYTEASIRHFGKEATQQDLNPIFEALEEHFYTDGCIGQISEIFDGTQPHIPRGAPAQAWSVAEIFRMLWLIEN